MKPESSSGTHCCWDRCFFLVPLHPAEVFGALQAEGSCCERSRRKVPTLRHRLCHCVKHQESTTVFADWMREMLLEGEPTLFSAAATHGGFTECRRTAVRGSAGSGGGCRRVSSAGGRSFTSLH